MHYTLLGYILHLFVSAKIQNGSTQKVHNSEVDIHFRKLTDV